MADNKFFEGFLDDYYAECEEHLTAARSALLTLEASEGQAGAQQRVIDDLFRFYHSLKGISAMVELRPAEQLAHELETCLRAVRAGEAPVSADVISALIDGTQLLEHIVNAHRLQQPQPLISGVVARLATPVPSNAVRPPAGHSGRPLPGGSTGQAASHGRWKCTFTPTRELLAAGIGVDTVRKRLGMVGTIVDAAPLVRSDGSIAFEFILETDAALDTDVSLQDVSVTVEPIEAPRPDTLPLSVLSGATDDQTPAMPGIVASHVVRVDLARLDELMRHVGDIVISRARLLDSLGRIEPHVPAVEWRAVQDNVTVIDRQVRTLREGLMRVRLVPIGEIFRRMPFVVRDLARESGKTITLLLQGQTTEIDKYLIERMMDPVLHLVRNAVSHGIELPDERIAQGKRPEGTITLSASAAGELVTIDISDDGRGIDVADVEARARAAGLHVPDGPLDSTMLLALLCSSGFSTKDAADRASGRGVGMAVVKDTVERLSGSIELESAPGTGTRFRIQLPLTLAIADALIGRVGQESFAVPQSAVREVIEVAAIDVRLIEQNEIIPYRDGALPIVRLSRLFGIDAPAPGRFYVFVVGTGTAVIGLAIDRIIGQREIVVRTLADPLVRVDGISGATDLGDGRVVLILDPASIVRLTRARASRALGNSAAWGRLRA